MSVLEVGPKIGKSAGMDHFALCFFTVLDEFVYIYLFTGIVYFLLCYNMIIAQTFTPIFANDGLCCNSPQQCHINHCGQLNLNCCRLQDNYICNSIINNYTTIKNIYHGSFNININNNTNQFYFRLYPTYIYFEYRLKQKSQSNAIGISWNNYNHPLPDLHFSIFANDKNKWQAFDILTEKNNYTIYPPNINDGEYKCLSKSRYCLPSRVLNFNYQTAYNNFNFVCPPFHQIFVQQHKICYCRSFILFQYFNKHNIIIFFFFF